MEGERPPSCRLVDAQPSDNGAEPAGVTDGRLAQEAEKQDWASFPKHHHLKRSMSRRGNCHDNAVAESCFNLLKRERIWRGTYKTRAKARQDVFEYIEMFYNLRSKHIRNGMLSPVEFERQHDTITEGVWKARAIHRG